MPSPRFFNQTHDIKMDRLFWAYSIRRGSFSIVHICRRLCSAERCGIKLQVKIKLKNIVGLKVFGYSVDPEYADRGPDMPSNLDRTRIQLRLWLTFDIHTRSELAPRTPWDPMVYDFGLRDLKFRRAPLSRPQEFSVHTPLFRTAGKMEGEVSSDESNPPGLL